MATRRLIIVFVHGWGVTNTASYGGLPERLRAEALSAGLDATISHVFLGRYISFSDEVRVSDVSRAFRQAVADEVAPLLADGERFACITHSTGGPVIRDWWSTYYSGTGTGRCPMSHLIMLAPANFGSALAQLGKGRVGRLKAWVGGVEPGQGVLDWLELGSHEAWRLNESWLGRGDRSIGRNGVFPFVLAGQTIDRAFYDHLNSYTGESGSDGVIRVAAANLNGHRIRLDQQAPGPASAAESATMAPRLSLADAIAGPETAMRIIGGASHTGTRRGIMRAVNRRPGHRKGRDTVTAILECLSVRDKSDYRKLTARFAEASAAVQQAERIETVDRLLAEPTQYIHDRCSMLVFRVSDDEGNPISDFDLLLTAGTGSDPNGLPRGFFRDRQRNSKARNTITYFLNYDLMVGSPALRDGDDTVRPATAGAGSLGLQIRPRPGRGFVHYAACEIPASAEFLESLMHPNATTLVDIRLRRLVRANVFRLGRWEGGSTRGNFKKTRPGPDVVD